MLPCVSKTLRGIVNPVIEHEGNYRREIETGQGQGDKDNVILNIIMNLSCLLSLEYLDFSSTSIYNVSASPAIVMSGGKNKWGDSPAQF